MNFKSEFKIGDILLIEEVYSNETEQKSYYDSMVVKRIIFDEFEGELFEKYSDGYKEFTHNSEWYKITKIGEVKNEAKI